VGRLKVEEFHTHAYAGLDDADGYESFEDLAFSGEFHAGAGIHGQRFAGADEAAAEGNVGGDAVRLLAGFEVDQFNVSRKGKTDGVAAVANSRDAGIGAIVIGHGDDFAHLAHLEYSRGERSLRANQTSTWISLMEAGRIGNNRLRKDDERVNQPPWAGAARLLVGTTMPAAGPGCGIFGMLA
jgi:hypothetical protein